jgi:hypothetical protein
MSMKKLRIVTIRVGDELRGRFATPADFSRQDCSPYRGLHVRRESLGFAHRSRGVFCRPVPNTNVTIRTLFIARRCLLSPLLMASPSLPVRRLAAALNSVGRELGAALGATLARADLSRRSRAVLHLTGRVMEQARQRLAVKQAVVEDKGDEVVEHLQRACALKLGELVARLPRGRPFRPRLAACASWQDMLPLAADVLQCALDEMDTPSAAGAGDEDAEEVEEDPAGKPLSTANALVAGCVDGCSGRRGTARFWPSSPSPHTPRTRTDGYTMWSVGR